MPTNPCSGVPDGEYTFGTCRGGQLIAPGSGLVGGDVLEYSLTISNRISTDGYIAFYAGVTKAGGYFYIRTPSGAIFNKVSVPANSIPAYRIPSSSFNETGNYTGVVTDLNGNIKVFKSVSVNATPASLPSSSSPASGEKEYVFDFSGPIIQNDLVLSTINKLVELLGGKRAYIEGNKLVVVV